MKRNFLPAFVTTIVAWLVVVFVTADVSPDSAIVAAVWLVAFFIGTSTMGYLLTQQWRRSLLGAIFLVSYLLFHMFMLDTVFNTFLLVGIILGLEYFFLSR